MILAVGRGRDRTAILVRPSGRVPAGFGATLVPGAATVAPVVVPGVLAATRGGATIDPAAAARLATSGWRAPVGMRSPFAPGAPLVRRVPGSWQGPSGRGAAVWTLVDIAQQARPVYGADGRALKLPDGSYVGSVTGGTVRRWIAGPLASACVRAARDALNRAVTGPDPAAMFEALRWVMGAYNACNVPWDAHAPARYLWRAYVSGGPDPRNPQAEFDPTVDFNAACTTAGNLPDRTYVGTGFRGSIAGAARDAFARCAPAGSRAAASQFVPAFAAGQVPAPPAGLADALVVPGRSYDRDASSALRRQNAAGRRAVPGFARPFGYVVDPATCARRDGPGAPGWTAAAFDADFVGLDPPPLLLAAPLAPYAAWLDAWVTALEALTPAQLVLDCLAYTTYLNVNLIQFAGGSAASAMGAELVARLHEFTPPPEATADLAVVQRGAPVLAGVVTALAAAALGAGAATAGVGTLVLGVATAVTLLATTMVAAMGDDASLRLDDLLRARPWLTTNALDGAPSDVTQGGAPSAIAVDAPPGYAPTADPAASGPPPAIVAPPASAATAVAALGAGAVGLGVLGQVLDWWDLADLLPSSKR